MSREFRTDDSDAYKMVYAEPHRELESNEREVETVAGALEALRDAGVIPGTEYDEGRFLAHRRAVREHFDIPWTAITPRMQRLLYAVTAITRPARMIAAGVFCGNTFVSNAGAAVGPGACYEAEDLVGVEIDAGKAAGARRNVRRIDPTGVARIVADDAVKVAAEYVEPVGLLYLDADGGPEQGKGIYLDILEAAWEKIPPGGVILAHNSVNCAERLEHYLAFVRDRRNCRASVNVVFDPEGLEVSVK